MPSPAYLHSPPPGSVDISPTEEITVCFRGVVSDAERDVNIRVAGMWAVCNGETQRGFETTRRNHKDGVLSWGIKKTRGLPPKDILVQAWCGQDVYTVDQRFFVRGSRAIYPNIMGSGVPEPIFEGYFHVGRGAWRIASSHIKSEAWRGRGMPAYRDGVYVGVYPDSVGRLVDGNIEYHTIPRFVLRSSTGWDVSESGLVVSCQKNEVIFSSKKDVHCWDISAKDVKICGGWIHLDMGMITAHLPVDYWPSKSEKGIDSWYVMENMCDGSNLFHEDLFIWWDKDRLVAKHSPDPILNHSNGMLWKKSDIGSEFKEVRILDSMNILVNKKLHLNTMYPKITRI